MFLRWGKAISFQFFRSRIEELQGPLHIGYVNQSLPEVPL